MHFQQKIQDQSMTNYEESNAAAQKRMMELSLAGVFPQGNSTIVGPYTTHTVYYYPSEALTIVERSKMDWAFFEVIKL